MLSLETGDEHRGGVDDEEDEGAVALALAERANEVSMGATRRPEERVDEDAVEEPGVAEREILLLCAHEAAAPCRQRHRDERGP